MGGEYRPRPHPWMNPEHVADILRRLVRALDADDRHAFSAALMDARRLLNTGVVAKSIQEAG